MKYMKWELGHQSAGSVVKVELDGTEANVRLLDQANLQSFDAGREHRYFGGHTKKTPVHIKVPYDGVWFAVVDLGGFGGTVQASVSVI